MPPLAGTKLWASRVTSTPQRPHLCSQPATRLSAAPRLQRGAHKHLVDRSRPASCRHACIYTSTCSTCTRTAHAPSEFPPCRPAPPQLLTPTSDASAPQPQTCRQLRGEPRRLHPRNPAPPAGPRGPGLGEARIVRLCF